MRHALIALVVALGSWLALPCITPAAETDAETAAYIPKVTVFDVQAQYAESGGSKIAAVAFKLKNEGDKTLRDVQVAILFKDAAGNVIATQAFYPVLFSQYTGGTPPLKPGETWQSPGHYGFPVPSSWAEGVVEVKVIGLKFATP
jgi:hypothetical protein